MHRQVLPVLMLVGFSMGQGVRTIRGFFDNLSCNGANNIFCSDVPQRVCCADTMSGRGGRFSSVRVDNPQGDELTTGWVPQPPINPTAPECSQVTAEGPEGSCTSAGQFGITGFTWTFVGFGGRASSPELEAPPTECRAPDGLAFYDGAEFNLADFSEFERQQLFDVAMSGNSSASLPASISSRRK